MPRIEELPNHFDQSLKISSSQAIAPPPIGPATTSQSTPFPIKEGALGHDGTNPPLPTQMASIRSHTADEIVQMMNQTPLFMTSLDNAGEGM